MNELRDIVDQFIQTHTEPDTALRTAAIVGRILIPRDGTDEKTTAILLEHVADVFAVIGHEHGVDVERIVSLTRTQ